MLLIELIVAPRLVYMCSFQLVGGRLGKPMSPGRLSLTFGVSTSLKGYIAREFVQRTTKQRWEEREFEERRHKKKNIETIDDRREGGC